MSSEADLSNDDKAFLVMEFFRIMHDKEEFIMIQRLIKKAMEIIQDNELFPLLKQLDINEFIVICDDIALLHKSQLKHIIEGLKPKISDDFKKEVARAVKIAKEKAKIE